MIWSVRVSTTEDLRTGKELDTLFVCQSQSETLSPGSNPVVL